MLFAAAAAVSCASGSGPSSGRVERAPRTSVRGPHGMLRVDEAGAGGLPILFVHGNGGNRSQWAEQIAHFSPSRGVAALDLSGMGDSELATPVQISVEGFAADVEAVADALGYRRYVLVGHSYGGAVVAACAGRRPDRVAAVVFADCAGDLHATPKEHIEPLERGLRTDYRRFTDKWFEGILAGARPETHAAVLDSLHRTPEEVFVGATRALYDFRLDDSLARFHGPMLSISSLLYGNPVAIHRTRTDVPVRRIEGASHWLMMDRPAEFDQVLEEFLKTVR
ncbi:MAG TPA: alpha/beta hydrolase [Thermoanaerobaculia bacterium]|nr:alpha/beta hydrolase [Thermoanaerobaculia bacterium]